VKDVPPEERIAVFDNDGTLWCEKPMPMGNSNGDVPMLQFAGGPSRPALRLLVLHDDAEREFDYTAGAEQALEQAQAQDWTVVSVKNDWATLGADATGSGR
jgi:hypothetical protein